MMPSALYELLADDSELTDMIGEAPEGGPAIFELQSVDERPIHDNYFIIFDFQETVMAFGGQHMGEQTFQIWVHIPLDVEREYNDINAIFNRIDDLLLPIEHVTGDDGIRVTMVRRYARSKNTIDPGWDTATRNALYGVLFDQSAA
jgi:hypothetical protein